MANSVQNNGSGHNSEERSFDEITYGTLLEKFIKNFQSSFNSTNHTNQISYETLVDRFDNLLKNVNPENYPEIMREKYIKNALIIAFYSLIIIVSLFGNLLVCNVILSKRVIRFRTTNIIIFNLTISDLLMTIFTIPVTIARLILDDWPFGSSLCIFAPFIQVTSVYVSTFSMTIIALDRYQVIVSPLKPRFSHKTPKPVIIALIWILAGFLSLPHAVFNRSVEMFTYKRVFRCRTMYPAPKDFYKKVLTALTVLTQYLIPLVITMFIYVIIGIRIARRACIGEMTEQQISSHIKSKRKTIKMLVLVVVVFAICWCPLQIYHILNDFYSTDFNLNTFYIVHWLAMSSVCYNPFIYFWLNKYYREGIKSVFFCRKISVKSNPSLASKTLFWSRNSSKSSYHKSNSRFLSTSKSSYKKSNSFTANSVQNTGRNCQYSRVDSLKSDDYNVKRKLSRIPTLTTTIDESKESVL